MSYIEKKTNWIKVKPSKESIQTLSYPIVVINRTLLKNQWVEKHKHRWGQFVYAKHGILIVITDTDRFIVPPEQGVWVPANNTHQVIAATESLLASFYLDLEQCKNLPEQCLVLEVTSFLKSLIIESTLLDKHYDWRSSSGRLLRLVRDQIILANPISLQLPYPVDVRLIKIARRLQKSPSDKKNLSDWGIEVGASTRTLSRLFKQETGLSYRQWRQRMIIQLSISKLYEGENITNIAYSLGYESPSAFTYMFKKLIGTTPSKYLHKLSNFLNALC